MIQFVTTLNFMHNEFSQLNYVWSVFVDNGIL